MTAGRMHADEVETDAALVQRLLAAQFPQWAELPIERVPSSGTDNALYRLGSELVVRLPRILSAAGEVDKDSRWLPQLAPLLPIAIPTPLAKGEPAEGFPWTWGVYRWLGGGNPTLGGTDGRQELARDLASFVDALHGIDLPGAPPARRGRRPLGETQAERADAALRELRGLGLIDVGVAAAVWAEAVEAPAWSGPPVLVHGDLLAGNLLVRAGRLTGVIDWSLFGLGDPACDLMAAWNVLPAGARALFRAEVGVDDVTWARGRGWALSQALIALPYYRETNPDFAANARHVIGEVVADAAGGLSSPPSRR